MFGRGFNIFEALFAHQREAEKERFRKKWGITNENGYDGITNLKIPHKYNEINVTNNSLFCKRDGIVTVYNYGGIKLFDSRDVMFLGDNRYLVEIIDEEILKDDWGYALFNGGDKLTEDIFKPKGRFNESFNEQGYYIVELCDKEKTIAVINKNGDIVYEHVEQYYFDYSTDLYGVILKTKEGYLNLITKTYICGERYRSYDMIENKECLFIKTEENCIYQINIDNGQFLIHGKEKEKEKPKTSEEAERLMKAKEDREKAQKLIDDDFSLEKDKWKKLSRNDKCLCGSGSKFKNCCHKNWLHDLRKKLADKYNG